MAIVYGIPGSQRDLLDKYPHAVKSIEDIGRVRKELEMKLEQENDGMFGRIKKWYISSKLEQFKENEHDPMQAGTRGELQVLDALSGLSDDYHVLCGVEIELPQYVLYRDHRNLRSAQMDFVVASERGVVVIEVKNWSNEYYGQYAGMSPHEQVDRAGLVLWISLKSQQSPQNPPVTKILLPIKENMRYDSNFRFVLVRKLDDINSFLTSQQKVFTKTETRRIVDRLKDFVAQ